MIEDLTNKLIEEFQSTISKIQNWLTITKYKLIVDIILTIIYFSGYGATLWLYWDIKEQINRVENKLNEIENKFNKTSDQVEEEYNEFKKQLNIP
jgi:predicted transcriptional regulator